MAIRSLNKMMLIGNMTRDPELRYTAKGTPICTFGLATNRQYTPVDATEPVEEAEFHNVVAWSKLAELCSQLLHKGDKVYIEGRLHTRTWEDQETNKRMYRTEVVADSMILLGGRRGPAPEVVGHEEIAAVSEVSTETGPVAAGRPGRPKKTTAAAAEPTASDDVSDQSAKVVQDNQDDEQRAQDAAEKDIPF